MCSICVINFLFQILYTTFKNHFFISWFVRQIFLVLFGYMGWWNVFQCFFQVFKGQIFRLLLVLAVLSSNCSLMASHEVLCRIFFKDIVLELLHLSIRLVQVLLPLVENLIESRAIPNWALLSDDPREVIPHPCLQEAAHPFSLCLSF